MRKIIVIPFNIPWNWSTDYTNQTAFELAKKGNIVVCYLYGDTAYLKEGFLLRKFPKLLSKYSKNIYLINPIFFIPFRRFKFITDLNSFINIIFLRLVTEILSIVYKCQKKIFWIFDPNLFPLYKYFGKTYLLLYDCVDFFAVGNKKNVEKTKRNEKLLCKIADVVVANSQILQKHLQMFREDVGLVPQGFRVEGFKINKKHYIDLKLKKPVIGFVGGINNRLDTQLLLKLLKNNPIWNFVLWGPIQKDLLTGSDRLKEINEILKSSNVKTGLSTDKSEIPGIVSQFDIGIIPYDISQDFNKYCYPMKLFEFFYLGKPVISTGIVELHRFPELVKIGHNHKEWEKIIKNILKSKWPLKKVEEERKLAIENSWKNKVNKILGHLHSHRKSK